MLVFFFIIVFGIIGFYLFKNLNSSTFNKTVNPIIPKGGNNVTVNSIDGHTVTLNTIIPTDSDIVIQNATNDTFYVEAFTTENKVSDMKYIAPGIPASTSNKKNKKICPKTELKPQIFIKISEIINLNLQLIIYYNGDVIKNYTYSDLYNIGKVNVINKLGLNISILDNTGKIGMYNLGIKNT